VAACTAVPHRGLAALRVVHEDPDPATVIHGLDAADVAAVGLHPFGTEDPPTARALEASDRVGQGVPGPLGTRRLAPAGCLALATLGHRILRPRLPGHRPGGE